MVKLMGASSLAAALSSVGCFNLLQGTSATDVYVHAKSFSDKNCTGTPETDEAFPIGLGYLKLFQTADFTACTKLSTVMAKHISGAALKLSIDEAKGTCSGAVYSDESCGTKVKDVPFFDGGCHYGHSWSCTKEAKGTSVFDKTCITPELLPSVKNITTLVQGLFQGKAVADSVCWHKCDGQTLKDVTGKESFEALFAKDGCAADCKEGDIKALKAAAVLKAGHFDCQFKAIEPKLKADEKVTIQA